MKKMILGLAFLGVILLSSVGAINAGYVNGYYRSNGTYVSGYYRSNPNAYRYDNYSYRGGSAYNDSYYTSYRSNSYKWNTPSWNTQSDYYTGLNSYNSLGGSSRYRWSY